MRGFRAFQELMVTDQCRQSFVNMLLRKYCHILRLHILIPTSRVIKALSLKKDTKTNRQSIVNDFITLAQINFTFLIIVNKMCQDEESSILLVLCSAFEYICNFSNWVLFREHSRFTGQKEKAEAIFLTPVYPFNPLRRHLKQPGDYCREFTSTHSQQPDSNRQPLVSEHKSLTTKLSAF